MIFVILILAILLTIYLIIQYIRKPKIGNLHLFSGGVKTGKTAYSVRYARKLIRKNRRKWAKKLKKGLASADDFPVLYSNMPLTNTPYRPLTLDIIQLKTRVPSMSIIYINECSLVAGSMDIRDPDVNDTLLQFFKLCAHLTHGGTVILDTQSPMDMHYSIKRSLSSYWHILNTLKLPKLGLISIIEQRQVVDSEVKAPIDNAEKRDNNRDLVEMLLPRQIFVRFCPASTFKYYDQFAYSTLTDDKPMDNQQIIDSPETGKIKKLLRLRGTKK